MKRLLLIPLLALPLLVLSCDEPAPTQPEADEVATTDPLFAAKPPPTFTLITNCDESGGDYYCGNVSGDSWAGPSVCPLQRGTFVFSYCRDNEFGNRAASSVCEAKQGRWVTIRREKLGPACALMQYFSDPSPVVGFRFKYLAQGSGYGNAWFGPWDFYGSSAP